MTPDDHAVLITVVYDGPPQAGKTTSVRSLARGFGREVFTPEERHGRTVYFDWLEHVGGRFEGSPIRCQVVSVPGQKRWTRRRGYFLDRADVVVFVGDTTAGGWPDTLARLGELRADLDARSGSPVGLVFQANKRDRADAVSLDEVRARAADARTAVIESIASDDAGVREAFVFAVRLALDRVRAELDRGAERSGFGERRGVAETLRDFDGDLFPELPPIPAPAVGAAGRLPSLDIPSGFVWPPIEGRILLREAAPSAGATVHTTADGDRIVASGTWKLHSPASCAFGDLEEARAVLVAWARQHASVHALLSKRRCIVLAEDGAKRWRLWQIVAVEPTLRTVVPAPSSADIERMVGELAAACSLPCTTDTIGITELRRPIYVGLMPPPSVVRA